MIKSLTFSFVLFLLAYLIGAGAVREIYICISARAWPTTTATLTMAKVGFHTSHEDSESSDRFSFNVEYNYQVDGRSYRNSRFAVRLFQESTSHELSPLVEKYKPNSQVSVYYDPDNHSYSLIEPSFFFISWFYAIIALGLALFAASMLWDEVIQFIKKS